MGAGALGGGREMEGAKWPLLIMAGAKVRIAHPWLLATLLRRPLSGIFRDER